MYARERRFREAVQRREFETQLANALDMADTEDEALEVTRLAIEIADTGPAYRAAARRQQPRALAHHHRVGW